MYTDPKTKLRFHSAQVYRVIQTLTHDQVETLLRMRDMTQDPIGNN